MKQILGILLVIVGVAYFSLQGFHYTAREQVLKIGPIQATEPTEKQILPYSPILGGVIILGGVALLVLGSRGRQL